MTPPAGQNPLDQLKAIHTPADVSAWPLAWGWWALIAVVLIILISAVIMWRKQRRFTGAKREALTLLASTDTQVSTAPANINAILKRVSRHYDEKAMASSRSGEQWQHYLTTTLPEKERASFTAGFSPANSNMYRPQGVTPDQAEAMKSAALLWVRKARIYTFSLRSSVKESARNV